MKMHPTVRESSSVNIAKSPGSPGITDSQEGALVLQTDGCGHKNELSMLHSSPQISSAGPLSPRAGQKPGIRTKNVKKYPISNDWPHAITAQYARTHFTGFAAAIHKHPPPIPPGLLKHNPTADATGTVKTILRLVPPEASKFGSLGTCLTIEKRRKQATLICPSPSTAIPVSQRRAGFGAPKMFAFDEVFSEQETTSDLCASALPDIIQAVVSGSDCCLIVLTNCRSNQAGIITGSEKPPTDLGIIPCSISWLFKLIAEQKEQTGARFSVRVSALEVDGQDESVKDLLVEVAQVSDALGTHPPGLYLREESVAKASMENQSELRAPTPEKAAFYLDSALNARARANKQHTTAFVQSDALHTPSDLQTANLNTSHFFFTLHLYQYRIEKCGGSSEGKNLLRFILKTTRSTHPLGLYVSSFFNQLVSGGRSRLHLIELDARCPDARDVASAAPRVSTTISSNTPSSTSPPITTSSRMTKTKLSTDSIISVILSILSGQTYIPYRNSHLARLLRDCLGGVNCQHCIVIEASSGAHHYAENLQLLQLVQRVQHHRKRRNPSRLVSTGSEMSGTAEKSSHGTSSEDSSSCDSFGLRRANRIRMHTGPYSGTRRSAFHRTKAGKRRSNVLNGTHSSERDYTSSSEQSCDTVIFLGRHEYHGSMAADLESQQSKPGLCRIINGSIGETQQPDNVDSGLPNQLTENSLASDATQAPAGSGDGNEIKASTKERTEGRVKTIVELRRVSTRGNVHAWSRVAVKNAIETLSTQKEQWVDGPKANFSPKKLLNAEPIQLICQSRTTKRECLTMEDKNTQPEATTDRWAVEECSAQTEAYGERNMDFTESSTPQCHKVLSTASKSHNFPQTHDYGLYGNSHPPDESAVDTSGQAFVQALSGTQEKTEHFPGCSPCAQCDRLTANEVPTELGKLHLTGTWIEPSVSCSACSASDALMTRSRSIFGPLATNLTRIRVQETDISIQNDVTIEGSNQPSSGPREQHHEKSPYHAHSPLNFNPFVTEWLRKHRVLTSSIEVDEQYAEKMGEMKSPNDETRKVEFVQNGHVLMDHPAATPNYLVGGPTAEAEKAAISRPYVPAAQPEMRETVCQKCNNLASQKPNRIIPTGEICDTDDHFSSKEINSNFARIAKWVKSVAMETGDTTVAEQRGAKTGKITSNDGAWLLNPIRNPTKPEGTKMRVFRLLFPTGLSNDTTTKVRPPTTHLHANTFSTQNAIPQTETEPTLSTTEIPLPCVPTLFPGHYRHRRGRSVPPRGFKQPGTRQLPSQATLHTLASNDISTTHPTILSSETPAAREQAASSSSSTSRRSHSAPPCSEDTSEATTSSPISVRYVPPKATTTVVSSLTTSLENSGAAKTDEPSVVANETHQEEIQEMLRQIRYERIYDLLAQQDTLKMELMKAKDRLMIDPATWSFDVCVAEQMDPDDEGFLDALELETEILQKRVDACKSRVMLITCFDIRTEAEINQPSTITASSSGL
ncbi:kinesin family member 26 [Clonorchis sinensis]|uniref:Kinesin family member 26 n=1 Tax=Clonorchis sinensis TaxID=79923 RepID=G7YIS0_CLOSI|nr:kinesin family member 26 [Clonorchis sinensis]